MNNNFKIILCSTAVLSQLSLTEVNATNMADDSLKTEASSQTIVVNSDDLFDVDDRAAPRTISTEQVKQDEAASTAPNSMNARTLFLRVSFLVALVALIA